MILAVSQETSAFISAISTIVLVIITFLYVRATNQILKEARLSRESSVRPVIRLFLKYEGGTILVPYIKNAGLGPAVNIDLEINYFDEKDEVSRMTKWRNPLMAARDYERFVPKTVGDNPSPYSPADFVTEFSALEIKGSCLDSSGTEIEINHKIENLEEWFELAKKAQQAVGNNPNNPVASAIKEVASQLSKLNESVAINENYSSSSILEILRRFLK